MPPLPSSSPCSSLPHASHSGGRLSCGHTGLSQQRDAPRGPGGLAVQAGPSHTQLLAVLGEEGCAPELGARANKLAAVHPGDC